MCVPLKLEIIYGPFHLPILVRFAMPTVGSVKGYSQNTLLQVQLNTTPKGHVQLH